MSERFLQRTIRFGARVALLLAANALLAQSSTVSNAAADRYLADVRALTATKMEGRGDGTKGLTRAAHLIEERFRSLGLLPAGTDGYLQPFTVVTGARLTGSNHLQVLDANGGTPLRLNQDFVPFSFSASGAVNSQVMFAGYGISAPEFAYDDYDGVDAKDKIVLLLRYEPPSFATRSGNAGMTHHAQLITKAINARNHGARALLLVNGKLGDGEEDLLTRFGSVSGPVDSGILLAQVKNAIADQWLAAAGHPLAALQEQINGSSRPASFVMPPSLHLSLQITIESMKAMVNNVLAWLPGESDEYVIIGAHYDHLGRGNFDSLAPSQIGQLHPGADDNASGTAGVLELARRFAPMKGKLRRGILFASFAGEELGLLGSAAWVQHPTRPLSNAVAMLNMDMIGRIKDEKVFIGGAGTGSLFQPLLAQVQKNSGLKIEYSPGGYSSSDHMTFVIQRIPSLFFFSGLHSDYHKPSDTWEKINAAGAVRLLNLVEDIANELVAAAQRSAFVTVVEDKPPVAGGGGYGPYFGSIPDFGQVENGVRFSDVRPGSPAAKAGLKAGDVLIQFGERQIHSLYDFTDALRRSRVGDVVQVTVMRGQEKIIVSVKLEQRR